MFHTALIGLLLVLFIVLLSALIPVLLFMFSLIKGAPFVPSDQLAIQSILKLISDDKPNRIAELGSGDGRIVMALAKAGYQIDGYEINPFLVIWSNWKIQRLNLHQLAQVYWKNFWSIDLTNYDCVVIYGFPSIMTELKDKIKREMPPHSRIISNHFRFPEWTPLQKQGSVYLYFKK